MYSYVYGENCGWHQNTMPWEETFSNKKIHRTLTAINMTKENF